jgi:hypothetical protein
LVSNTARNSSVTFPVSVDGHPIGDSLAAYPFANLAQLRGELVTRLGTQGYGALPGCPTDIGRGLSRSLLSQERNDIQHNGQIIVRKIGDLDHCASQQGLVDYLKIHWLPFPFYCLARVCSVIGSRYLFSDRAVTSELTYGNYSSVVWGVKAARQLPPIGKDVNQNSQGDPT